MKERVEGIAEITNRVKAYANKPESDNIVKMSCNDYFALSQAIEELYAENQALKTKLELADDLLTDWHNHWNESDRTIDELKLVSKTQSFIYGWEAALQSKEE